MSPLSRNRTFGVNLGRGMSVAEVVAVTRQTAEGVKSCDSVLQLAKDHGVDVPIIEQVAAVVHEGRTPQQVVESLLARARKAEVD
jgi:glycerol-3-phosphate dehydrogenase (NAD(P)+)